MSTKEGIDMEVADLTKQEDQMIVEAIAKGGETLDIYYEKTKPRLDGERRRMLDCMKDGKRSE